MVVSIDEIKSMAAVNGYRVFPCSDKQPLINGGCHAGSNDPAQIEEWWKKWPKAQVGIATGHNNVWVLDVDIDLAKDKNGFNTLEKFVDENGPLPHGPYVNTPRGGRHYYFTAPEHLLPKNSVERIGHALDTRGLGGYVIAPPTPGYEWQEGYLPIPEAPKWLLDAYWNAGKKTTDKPTPKTSEGIPIPSPALLSPTNDKASNYNRRAVELECASVRSASEGTRNATLNKAALKLGHLVAGAGLSESFVRGELYAAAIAAGLSDLEAQRTIQSGISKGMDEPRTPVLRGGISVVPLPQHGGQYGGAEVEQQREAICYPLTDMGNAERFRDANSDRIAWDMHAGVWRIWNEKIWAVATHEQILKEAFAVARMIQMEAVGKVEDEYARIMKWSIKSESNDKLSAMIALAKAHLCLPSDRFDADKWLLNCNNGMVNLQNGELEPFDRWRFITRLCPVDFVPGATDKILEKVLLDAMPEEELRRYTQKLIGYTLAGDTSEEVMAFVYGPEASAKSTLTEAVRRMMGTYATVVEPDVFMTKPINGGATPELARLKGARMVLTSESDEGKAIAAGLIKRLSGNDTISCRELYKTTFEYQPQFKIWLVSNFRPRVDANDGAMWRRLRVMPFEHTIPTEKRDPRIKLAMIKTQAQRALLAWAVEGCILWQAEGLKPPEIVQKAGEEYRESQDSLADFFRDYVEFVQVSDTFWETSQALRDIYKEYAEKNDVPERFRVSSKKMAEVLKGKGCKISHGRYGSKIHGIKLKFS